MNHEHANKVLDDMCNSFLSKKRLLLTVDVRTKEEAEEIMNWMYGNEKPMKAALHEISWDKALVSQKVVEAIETLRKSFDA